MNDSTLYRDASYGALGLIRVPCALGVAENHFADLELVLEALEGHATPPTGPGPGYSVWKLREHVDVTLARISATLRRHGYSDDPLGERAILSVSETQAIRPDLPSARTCRVVESVERGLGAVLDEALVALGTPAIQGTVMIHERPHALDGLGRPLPFVRALAVLAECPAGLERLERDLREALAGLGSQLVRATIRPAENLHLVEVGIAPARTTIDALQGKALPAFQEAQGALRAARFELGVPIEESALRALRARAEKAGAATLLERKGDSLLALVPAAQPGDPVADPAVRERTAWLAEQLAPWSPSLEEISDLLPRK